MIATLDHPACLENDDLVGGLYGGQAVGDHQRGAAFGGFFEGILYGSLGSAVEG